MFSLNLANIAISSAIAMMPFSDSVYGDVQTELTEKAFDSTKKKEIKEIVLTANALLSTFFMIASDDPAIFDRLAKTDFILLFTSADEMVKKLKVLSTTEEDKENLSRFIHTLAKSKQLYDWWEYKKEMDKVVLSRGKDSRTIIPAGSSRAEISQLLGI